MLKAGTDAQFTAPASRCPAVPPTQGSTSRLPAAMSPYEKLQNGAGGGNNKKKIINSPIHKVLKSGCRETFCLAIFPCPLAGG